MATVKLTTERKKLTDEFSMAEAFMLKKFEFYKLTIPRESFEEGFEIITSTGKAHKLRVYPRQIRWIGSGDVYQGRTWEIWMPASLIQAQHVTNELFYN